MATRVPRSSAGRTPARKAAKKTSTSKTPKKTAAAKASGKKPAALVNHIAVELARSGSMGSIRKEVIDVFNKQLKTIQTNATQSGQETWLSYYTFHSTVDKPLYFAKQAQAVPKLTSKTYTLGGTTALLDAVGRSVTDLSKVKGANKDHVSFLIIVITDGEENASKKYKPATLKKLLAGVQKTGRWSLAFLAPKSGVKALTKLGIPAGNIQDWSATAKGAREMGERVARGLDTFYAARGQGQRAVSKFFTTDMTGVDVTEVQGKLTESTADFTHWLVDAAGSIRDFVNGKLTGGKQYEKGRGYYELTKPETVQEQKTIAIMDRGTNAIYVGPAARAMLGLPYSGSVKVKPGSHGNFAIFVESTSVNRVLVKGTTLLYKTS